MTEEQKKILLKDLSARVPYGVKARVRINTNYVKYSDAHKPDSETWIGDIWGITTNKPLTAWVYSFITIYPCAPVQNMCSIADCKPYLRPLESMTDEERKVYDKLSRMDDEYSQPYDSSHLVDWLNEHHFDHRGLIGMGLALLAPEGMYDNKNN